MVTLSQSIIGRQGIDVAVAVIPVILFHAGFEEFSGGFVGVYVFFVISDYLITSMASWHSSSAELQRLPVTIYHYPSKASESVVG